MAIPAKSINEVISELDKIIGSTVAENNLLGIFTCISQNDGADITGRY